MYTIYITSVINVHYVIYLKYSLFIADVFFMFSNLFLSSHIKTNKNSNTINCIKSVKMCVV